MASSLSFSNLSIELTNIFRKEYENEKIKVTTEGGKAKNKLKNEGIYFTHPDIIKKNLDYLKSYFSKIKTVLEPSCGSGEYILALQKLYPNIEINGIELDKTIYDFIKNKFESNIDIRNEDFLKCSSSEKYDLIIGNPPYFVLKKDLAYRKYQKYYEGRPNIFIYFILKSLEMLNNNGILSFVLPCNFLNCLYYEKTRKYIETSFKILGILNCPERKFMGTAQKTIILIIQKTNTSNFHEENKKYVIEKGGKIIFGVPKNISKLKDLFLNSSSLKELGFEVSVGSVVWNQHKNFELAIQELEAKKTGAKTVKELNSIKKSLKEVTDTIKKAKEAKEKAKENEKVIKEAKEKAKENEEVIKEAQENKKKNLEIAKKGTTRKDSLEKKYTNTNSRLIYSSDIVDNKLIMNEYSNIYKKNFINKPGFTGPLLVINRGYGTGKYKFNYCLINIEQKYLIENHLICIKYVNQTSITDEDLIEKYKKIINSLNDKRTKEFVELYFSNDAINTTELNTILPIYQDI